MSFQISSQTDLFDLIDGTLTGISTPSQSGP